MVEILDDVNKYIIVPYLITFVLLTYALKDVVVSQYNKVFRKPLRGRYVVFILATLLAVPFYIFHDNDPIKLLVTYTVGTSLYDLIIPLVMKKIGGSDE